MNAKNLTREQLRAYEALGIDPKNRIIISLDGGGIRGILTLQLLKKIEEIAGLKINQFCDMLAGTSTGAIIAGLMAFGLSAVEIEKLYIQLVTKVFQKRNILANRYINPPAYSKTNYRQALKEVLENCTLKEACLKSNVDIFITAKDITDNEETYFTCFNNEGLKGTYQDALLRTVMEATMSAPTYFNPLERFIDGGTTTYNNPSLAALMEAIRYDGNGKYQLPDITLFSFGTGRLVKSVSPADGTNPHGPDAYFWLNYVMDESSQDASSMQVDLFRSGMISIDYRRYQISFDTRALSQLPDKNISALHFTNANWLRDIKDQDLRNIEMDDVGKFDLMKIVGEAMVDYIMQKNKFKSDLTDADKKRDCLVTAFENISRIKDIVEKPEWIDKING